VSSGIRARDLGITIGEFAPGAWNAVTDVEGVRVGHSTLEAGEDIHTGVTIIMPGPSNPASSPVFAGVHRLNGYGELTGSWWIAESGLLTSPIALTNTYSVGAVHEALIAHSVAHLPTETWDLPVVGETSDSRLNRITAMAVGQREVDNAIAAASIGPVDEGNVGGGTGMICHGFKGGIGTASRVVTSAGRRWTVGVLVQANHGRRNRLMVAGAPVGKMIDESVVPAPRAAGGGRTSSIIGIVATDAPLLPHQCARLAQRASFGVARTGGTGEDDSGDLFLAFSTGTGTPPLAGVGEIVAMGPGSLDPLADAAIEATEEAIVNALVAARTMSSSGTTAHAIPHDLLMAAVATRPPVSGFAAKG
jgi:D-aminopeptidase